MTTIVVEDLREEATVNEVEALESVSQATSGRLLEWLCEEGIINRRK
jgi:hypothetical protein